MATEDQVIKQALYLKLKEAQDRFETAKKEYEKYRLAYSAFEDVEVEGDTESGTVLLSGYPYGGSYKEKILFAIQYIGRGCSKKEISKVIAQNDKVSIDAVSHSVSVPLSRLVSEGEVEKVEPSVRMRGYWYGLKDWTNGVTWYEDEHTPPREK